MFNFKLIFVLLLINTYQVNAVVVTGNTAGVFLVEEIGVSGVVETALFEWGIGARPSILQSSLGVAGVNSLSIDTDQPFKIAELTYSNTDITSSSSFVSTYLNVDLDIRFNYTASNSPGSYQFKSNVDIIETDNSLSDSDDRVSVILDNSVNPLLSINGGDYVFELLGFSNSNGDLDHFFIQPEDTSSTIDLYAKITAVPLPSAALLFITAFSGLFISANRRGRKG